MEAFSEICDWFDINLKHADPWAIALKLGALTRTETNNEQDRLRLQQTLTRFRETSTPQQLQHIRHAIERYQQQNMFMDGDTIRLLQSAQCHLLTLPDFISCLTPQNIVEMGKDYMLYRVAFIALLRKANPQVDAFADFDFNVLSAAGAEQTTRYVRERVKKCPLLPIPDLIELSMRPQVAMLLLEDCSSHEDYFKLSAEFASRHSSMREVIARDWQVYSQNYPLTDKQNAHVKAALPKLGAFPEFSNLHLEARVPRAVRRTKTEGELYSSLMGQAARFFESVIRHNLSASQECVGLMHKTKTLILSYPPRRSEMAKPIDLPHQAELVKLKTKSC